MPYILSDVPSIIRCLVRAEFTQNHQRGHGTYLKAHILGIRCQEAASLQFQVRFDEPSIAGAMFCLPIQALCWKPCDMPDVELVQPWDTFSSDFTVHEFGLWKRGNAQLLNVRGIEPWPERLDARYLFTVDFKGNALADCPQQHKSLHVLQVEHGWIAAVPNNRVISVDEAFEKPCAELPRFESLEYLYAAECRIGEPRLAEYGPEVKPQKISKNELIGDVVLCSSESAVYDTTSQTPKPE
jgi:hypothetical protein